MAIGLDWKGTTEGWSALIDIERVIQLKMFWKLKNEYIYYYIL
jgi:hypothetical protein